MWLLIEQGGLVCICSWLTTSVTYNVLIFLTCLLFYLSVATLIHIPPDITGWISVYTSRNIHFSNLQCLNVYVLPPNCLCLDVLIYMLSTSQFNTSHYVFLCFRTLLVPVLDSHTVTAWVYFIWSNMVTWPPQLIPWINYLVEKHHIAYPGIQPGSCWSAGNDVSVSQVAGIY